MSIFLSHNKADREAARETALFLVAEDLAVWFDEWEVAAGDSIVGKVSDALSACTHFLVLWSKHALKSEWVRKELSSALSLAIASGNPRVIPVRLDDTPLPPLLADLRYIRYRHGSEEGRHELIMAITGKGPSTNFIRAVVKKYHEVIRSPQREETLGFKACPQCGSENIKPWSEWLVDQQHDGSYDGVEVPGLMCGDCEWKALAYEIEKLSPESKPGEV